MFYPFQVYQNKNDKVTFSGSFAGQTIVSQSNYFRVVFRHDFFDLPSLPKKVKLPPNDQGFLASFKTGMILILHIRKNTIKSITLFYQAQL